MKLSITTLKNEEGSVMIVSIVILALLTIIGIAVTTTSSVELQIAGNEKAQLENLYLAEGAAMMIAQILENQDDLEDNRFPNPNPEEPEDVEIPELDLNSDSILSLSYKRCKNQ